MRRAAVGGLAVAAVLLLGGAASHAQVTYEWRAVEVARATLPDSTAAPGGLVDHPGLLEPLDPDGPFPRFTPEELAAAGFPDHMHAFMWPGWTPPLDAEGKPYGPGSICDKRVLKQRPDLDFAAGLTVLGPFRFQYEASYTECDLMPVVELCDLAARRCRELLDAVPAPGAVLHIFNTEGIEEYRERTGYSYVRTYALRGDSCTIEPAGTLWNRTLAAHTVITFVTRWTVRQIVGEALPPWLDHGLALYLAEMGTHLVNYVAEFRVEREPGSDKVALTRPVLLDAATVDSLLTAPPDPDDARDRELHRKALYGAFLMAWRLVEDEGGLPAVRRFLQEVGAGAEPEAAARRAWGTDLAGLAVRLDPAANGEVLGDAIRPRPAHRSPGDVLRQQARGSDRPQP